MFKSLGLIKLFGIALFQIVIFMYKFHNNEQVFIIMHIILDLQQNTLTIFLMLEPTMANLICFEGPAVWIAIDDNVKLSSFISVFKKRLKDQYGERY